MRAMLDSYSQQVSLQILDDAASLSPNNGSLLPFLIALSHCPFSYFALPCATPVLGLTKLVSLGTENHIAAKGPGDSCRMALRSGIALLTT